MKHTIKWIVLLLGLSLVPVYAEEETPLPEATEQPTETVAVETSAAASILIDATSGSVLFENNSELHLDPASLTKMMSVYLATSKLSDSTPLTMSESAFQTYDHSAGVLWIQTGETMSAQDAEYASMLASANDTTAMLAEAVSGTPDQFVALMNSTAADLGMGNTNFQNPFGINHEENYSSAKDLATFLKKALANKTFAKIFGTTGYTMDATNVAVARPIGNDCKLLPGMSNAYPATTGCKIGSTNEGGYAIAASSEQNNMKLIAIVLGEPDAATAYADTVKLFDYGYSSYHTVTLSASEIGTKTVEVYDGKKHTADVVFSVQKNFSILLPSSIDASTLTSEILVNNETESDPKKITATVQFLLDGKSIGTVDMDASIQEIGDAKEEGEVGTAQQYFEYGCAGLLVLFILLDVARAIAPPVE